MHYILCNLEDKNKVLIDPQNLAMIIFSYRGMRLIIAIDWGKCYKKSAWYAGLIERVKSQQSKITWLCINDA